MSEQGPRSFCTKCGAPLAPGVSFCTTCGVPVAAPGVAAAPGATAAQAPEQTTPGAPPPTSIAGALRTTASYAGTAAALGGLGWQTVVQGQPPDMKQFLARAGVPVAQQVVRRSVRKPAFALIITTLLDLFVAWVMGQPSAMAAAGMRLAMGVGTGVLGLFVGKRGGFFRYVVGIGSLATTVLQGYNAVGILVAAIGRQAPLLQLIPSIVSTASVIFVAVRMAFTTFRRVKQK